MAEKIELGVGELLTRVELKADDGTVVGYALANFNNPRLFLRLKEFSGYFSKHPGTGTILELDADMQDKFCYVFGYDCRAQLFGVVSPTDRIGGEQVALRLTRAISESFTQAQKETAEKREKEIAKHLGKYDE